MMSDLTVELYGTSIGQLRGDWRSFDFHATPSALAEFGIDSPVLSLAIPLAPVTPRGRRQQRQAFFAGLLPEGRMLTHLAGLARVAEHDVVGLLRTHGRDLAGALQIWDPSIPGEPRTPRRVRLDDDAVAQLLRDVSARPLGNARQGGKTSLAGVQDKIVLAREDERWHQVLDGYPSTHILKPMPAHAPTMIFDEEYGSRFARQAGSASFVTSIQTFAGDPALVIERYDRFPGGRLHQEDLAQALGLIGNEKYQRHGGRVSLKRIAATLSGVGLSPDALLRLVTLAVAVGNLDLHAKNISLLHNPDGSMELAPAYDVVPQAHQPSDGEMALSVDDEYRHAALTRESLIREAQSWGLSSPETTVAETLETVRDTARREAPLDGSHPGIASDVENFATRLLDGQPVGDAPSTRGYRRDT